MTLTITKFLKNWPVCHEYHAWLRSGNAGPQREAKEKRAACLFRTLPGSDRKPSTAEYQPAAFPLNDTMRWMPLPAAPASIFFEEYKGPVNHGPGPRKPSAHARSFLLTGVPVPPFPLRDGRKMEAVHTVPGLPRSGSRGYPCASNGRLK